MIHGFKARKDEYIQCTSCQCCNDDNDIYILKIGKTMRQTMSIKLCYDCLIELSNIVDSFDFFPYEDGE